MGDIELINEVEVDEHPEDTLEGGAVPVPGVIELVTAMEKEGIKP